MGSFDLSETTKVVEQAWPLLSSLVNRAMAQDAAILSHVFMTRTLTIQKKHNLMSVPQQKLKLSQFSGDLWDKQVLRIVQYM